MRYVIFGHEIFRKDGSGSTVNLSEFIRCR